MKENKKSEEIGNGQQIYRVRLYKDYDIPSCSVDKGALLQDLTYQVMDNAKDDESEFKVELINVLPFTIEIPPETKAKNSDFDFFARELAVDSTKELYGELDYSKNPGVYELYDKSVATITFRLKPNIEDFFMKQLKKFTNIFETKRVRL